MAKEIKLTKCRVCEGEDLTMFLDLGMMPSINKFLNNKEEIEKEELFPLEVAFCNTCAHVQLTVAIDQEDTFSDYIYFSSNSSTFVNHGKWLAEEMKKRLSLTEDDLVIEIASNDGCFLKSFKALSTKVLGVEPAKNIAKVAEEAGIPTIAEFFGEESAKKILEDHGPAKLMIGANVLAHAFYLRDFVRGLKLLLHKEGTVAIEVPYIKALLDGNEFDTIYHEHISYFSVQSLKELFKREGLELYNIDYLPELHGGTILASIQHEGGPNKVQQIVYEYLNKEKEAGLDRLETYQEFANRIESLKTAIPDFIKKIKAEGKTIAAYGAAAKGNVLMQYCGINTDLLPYIADKSPYKQGKFTPGSHLPVVAPQDIIERRPDYLIILAWNFAKEIIKDMDEYTCVGGKYIVPLPEPKIL